MLGVERRLLELRWLLLHRSCWLLLLEDHRWLHGIWASGIIKMSCFYEEQDIHHTLQAQNQATWGSDPEE